MNLAPSCRMRDRCAPLYWNISAAGTTNVLGYPLHSVWLNTLKASARNSTAALSLMANRLNSAMSKFARPGLRKLFLPALPNVRPVGTANAAGLYFNGGDPAGIPELGSLTWSGYEPVPTLLPTPAL